MTPRKGNAAKRLQPAILIFDIDGVLIDVRETYWRSALETVRHLSGKRVTYADLHKWKSKPGHNDDWRMTANWVTSLGRPTTYDEARAAFEKFYWGTDGKRGQRAQREICDHAAADRALGRAFRIESFHRKNAAGICIHVRHLAAYASVSARSLPWTTSTMGSRTPRDC